MRLPILDFAQHYLKDGHLLDEDPAAVGAAYDIYVHQGLHAFGSARWAASPEDTYHWLRSLAVASGAFAFVAYQQWYANELIKVSPDSVWPRVGIALNHLRNPGVQCPRARDGMVSGVVPWYSGSELFDQALLGYIDEDGSRVVALVDSRDGTGFAQGSPLQLVAMMGAGVVAVEVRVPLPEAASEVLRVPADQEFPELRSAMVWHAPLLLGNAAASIDLIAKSPRASEGAISSLFGLLERLDLAAISNLQVFPEDGGLSLRSAAAKFAVECARKAAYACGSASLSLMHPVQRLYREALVLNMMCTTDQVVLTTLDGPI